MAKMSFEWDEDGFRKLQENLARAFQDVSVPTGGSEEDAIADVKRQLIAQGVEPNDEGIVQFVREHRQG